MCNEDRGCGIRFNHAAPTAVINSLRFATTSAEYSPRFVVGVAPTFDWLVIEAVVLIAWCQVASFQKTSRCHVVELKASENFPHLNRLLLQLDLQCLSTKISVLDVVRQMVQIGGDTLCIRRTRLRIDRQRWCDF